MEVQAMSLRALAVLVVAVSLAACGGSGPTGPSTVIVGDGGATLRGQFQQGGAASALRTLGSTTPMAQITVSSIDALTVVVLDSGDQEIARVEVKDGAFTLRGLPEDFKLVFVDANDNPVSDQPIEFIGVKPNQEVDIVLAVQNGSVMILEERRTGIDHPGASGIEIEGKARRIAVDSNDDPMTGSLDVDGYHVLTKRGETSIRKGNRSLTLADLDSGERVHVRGVYDGTNVFAYEIKLQEEDDDTNTSPSSCNVKDPAKEGHILICHKGRTTSVSKDAWSGHREHGDTCGPCN
jgi:hypothetical protein